MTNISLCLQARYGSDPFLHKHLYTCPTILKKSFDSLTIFETQRNAEINACFGSYLSPTSYPKRCDIEIKQGYRISFIAMKPLIRHRKLHNRTLVPILSLNKWDNGTKYIAKVVDGNDCKKLGGEYEVLQFYGKKNEKPTFYFDYPLLTNCNTIQVFPDRYPFTKFLFTTNKNENNETQMCFFIMQFLVNTISMIKFGTRFDKYSNFINDNNYQLITSLDRDEFMVNHDNDSSHVRTGIPNDDEKVIISNTNDSNIDDRLQHTSEQTDLEIVDKINTHIINIYVTVNRRKKKKLVTSRYIHAAYI